MAPMHTPHSLIPSHTRRGFNLVEAAIVLGVIGLVIGGIWVAASSVSENQRLNNAAMGIEAMVRQYRSLYAGHASSSIPMGANWVNTSLFDMPSGWTRGSYPVSPWGDGVYVDTGGGANPDIEFYFYNVPKARCINLAISLSKLPNYTSTPRTVDTANTFCNQAVMPQIAFSYYIF